MAKKRKNYDAIIESCDTGSSMADAPPLYHIKFQAFSGGGKTHSALANFDYFCKGKDPAECLMTVIDCDLEGQASLVRREDILNPKLRPRLYRKVCSNPDEVNEVTLAFIDLHRKHYEKYPEGVRVMLFDNEAAYYLSCRDFYAQEVHGQSEADLLLSRQAQAISEGKKTLPAFAEGQMHSYKVINRVFYTPFQRLKMAAEMFHFHFFLTTLLREYTENYGQANEKKVVASAGRADMTDPLFEWIIELDVQQRTKGRELQTRYRAVTRKSRNCKPFQMVNPTPEKWWKAVKDNTFR